MGYFRLMGPVVDADLPVEQALAGGAPQRVGSYRFYFAERWEWSPEVERIHGYGPLGFRDHCRGARPSPNRLAMGRASSGVLAVTVPATAGDISQPWRCGPDTSRRSSGTVSMFALRGAREVKADTCAATAALVRDLAAATGITAVRVQEAFVVAVELPSWLAEPAVHRSHRALVRKLAHFRRFFPDVPDDLPYVWSRAGWVPVLP